MVLTGVCLQAVLHIGSSQPWQAGIFLVCYCAVLDADDLCASPNYYISAARQVGACVDVSVCVLD